MAAHTAAAKSPTSILEEHGQTRMVEMRLVDDVIVLMNISVAGGGESVAVDRHKLARSFSFCRRPIATVAQSNSTLGVKRLSLFIEALRPVAALFGGISSSLKRDIEYGFILLVDLGVDWNWKVDSSGVNKRLSISLVLTRLKSSSKLRTPVSSRSFTCKSCGRMKFWKSKLSVLGEGWNVLLLLWFSLLLSLELTSLCRELIPMEPIDRRLAGLWPSGRNSASSFDRTQDRAESSGDAGFEERWADATDFRGG